MPGWRGVRARWLPRGRCQLARGMLDRDGHGRQSTDDPLAPVTLAVGQEDLLLDRAVQQVVAAARAADADTDVRDLTSDQLQPGTLAELTSPSLFAERKVVVVRNAQDLSADTVKDVKAYLGAPAEEITLVLLHAGGAKGKGLLDAARKAGAREVACPKMTKPADRLAFVRGEFRALGRSATPGGVPGAGRLHRQRSAGAGVGAVSQLAADVEGTIDEAVVGALLHGPGRGVELHGRRPCRRGPGGRGAGGAAVVAVDRGRARPDHQRARAGRPGDRQAVLRPGRPARGPRPRAGHAALEDRPGAPADARVDAGRGGGGADARSRRPTRASRAAGTTPSTPWRRPWSPIARAARSRRPLGAPGRPGRPRWRPTPRPPGRRRRPPPAPGAPAGAGSCGHLRAGRRAGTAALLGRSPQSTAPGPSVHAWCAAPAWRTQAVCGAGCRSGAGERAR